MEFVDGLADVTVAGGIARLEFFTVKRAKEKAEDGSRAFTRIPAVSLAIPVEGLVAAVKNLEAVRNHLLEEGVRETASAPSPIPMASSRRTAAPAMPPRGPQPQCRPAETQGDEARVAESGESPQGESPPVDPQRGEGLAAVPSPALSPSAERAKPPPARSPNFRFID